MRSSIRLHLDEDFWKIAERLVTELGWTPSKVAGEALRIFAERGESLVSASSNPAFQTSLRRRRTLRA
jgi:hypothetical protein